MKRSRSSLRCEDATNRTSLATTARHVVAYVLSVPASLGALRRSSERYGFLPSLGVALHRFFAQAPHASMVRLLLAAKRETHTLSASKRSAWRRARVATTARHGVAFVFGAFTLGGALDRSGGRRRFLPALLVAVHRHLAQRSRRPLFRSAVIAAVARFTHHRGYGALSSHAGNPA